MKKAVLIIRQPEINRIFPKDLQLPLEDTACALDVIKVAVQAHTKSRSFVNARENPKMILPNDATLVLIPEGGCITEWEEI